MAEKEPLSELPRTDETSALQAVTDSINQMAGSLTGRNLEQKIQEYTAVYGEILLGMHNRLNDLEREARSLRKENAQQHRRIIHLEQREGNGASSPFINRTLPILALLVSSGTLIWLLLTLTKN